jgi:hypothetical protein
LTHTKWINNLPQKEVLKEQLGYKKNNNVKNLIRETARVIVLQ